MCKSLALWKIKSTRKGEKIWTKNDVKSRKYRKKYQKLNEK